MTIKQARVAMPHFRPKLLKKFGLADYHDRNEPAVFHGIYTHLDLTALINHRSHSTVVWCGNDSVKLTERTADIIRKHSQRNIAKSSFIRDTLLKHGIKSEVIPVTPTENVMNDTPKGHGVYYYGSPTRPEQYGYSLLQEVKRLIPFEVLEANCDTYTASQLKTIYGYCFIGLRLIKHDGLPNTVCELGLMGRKCIYNGELPHSIKWKTAEDIAQSIIEEYGKPNGSVAQDMHKYLNIDNDWLRV